MKNAGRARWQRTTTPVKSGKVLGAFCFGALKRGEGRGQQQVVDRLDVFGLAPGDHQTQEQCRRPSVNVGGGRRKITECCPENKNTRPQERRDRTGAGTR